MKAFRFPSFFQGGQHKRIMSDLTLRWLLAGPGALVVSITTLAGMPVWFPRGGANVDHMYLPMTLLPGIWGIAFFYAVLSERLGRVACIFLLVTVVSVSIALGSGGWT